MILPPRMPPPVRALRWALGLAITLAFPLSALAVFRFGADRRDAADVLACVYAFGLTLLFSSSLLPLRALAGFTRDQRIASAAVLFLGVSYATHLTWELGWLLLFDTIRESPDALWAYPWWAYIDGGDARFLHGPPELFGIEALSVANALVGVTAMGRFFRGRGTRRAPVLALMGTAIVHFYSATLYYLSEFFGGMTNVDTTRFVNLWIKFGLTNLPWVVMPWFVLVWGRRAILGRGPA